MGVEADQFQGMGMPFMYILVCAAAVVVGSTQFRATLSAIRQNILSIPSGLFLFASINSILTIFIFFSPAIHYGLVTFLLSFITTALVGQPNFKAMGRPLCLVYVLWFIVLTGIVGSDAGGMLGSVSNFWCQVTYPNAIDLMCKNGWTTFLIFCSIFVIAHTFLSILLLITLSFDDLPMDSGYSSIGGRDEASAERGSGYAGKPGDGYQQVA